MNCLYCKGEMRRGRSPFHVDRKGVHLSLDEVPAWVCGQCGEVYFDEAEVDTIQAIIREVEDRARKLAATS